MKKPVKLIFIIIPAILFIAYSIVAVIAYSSTHQTKKNTLEYVATISHVQTNAFDQIEIYTEEYKNAWIIEPYIAQHIQDTDLLKEGQTIRVGINKLSKDSVNGDTFVQIVSLRVGTTDLMTISDYNQYMKEDRTDMSLSIIPFLSLCLSAVIFLSVLRVKRIRYNAKYLACMNGVEKQQDS